MGSACPFCGWQLPQRLLVRRCGSLSRANVQRTSRENDHNCKGRMSELGHLLPMRLVSASYDVRSTPKADIRFQRNICTDGPNCDICTAANAALFNHLVGTGE